MTHVYTKINLFPDFLFVVNGELPQSVLKSLRWIMQKVPVIIILIEEHIANVAR